VTVEDLVQWLRAQFDEDEEDVRRGYLKAEPIPDYDGWDKSTTAALPPAVAARVLRDIDAKRRILAEHALNGWVCTTCDNGEVEQTFPCPTLRILALPYADRPGYREEWRP
jgi:hypothetical protein